MVSTEIISNLKKSSLALGLTKKGTANPILLAGSGFMIDEDGFFVSAAHVSNSVYTITEKLKKNGTDVDVRIFISQARKDHSEFVSIKVGLGYELRTMEFTKEDTKIVVDSDIYVGRVLGNEKYPFLKFDEPTKIQILDPVIMCGYPSTSSSINLHSDDNTRWSPIIQPGIISSLLPIDESQNPYGIQTDIIGTAGSSGSAIINADTGVVLGIAQKILPAEISIPEQTAKIGLTYGISNYFAADAINQVITQIKSEIDEKGNPKTKITTNQPFTFSTENYDLSDVYKNK